MQNEHEFFNTLNASSELEPRQEFVLKAKQTLLQKARQIEYRRKIKKRSLITSGIAVTAFLLVWISFLGGKQVIFDTVSLFLDHDESEIIEISENGEIAKRYLEEKGYDIVSYDGSINSYILTLEKIVQPPFIHEWALQEIEPDNYFEKLIDTELFTVQGHSLDYQHGSMGKTTISVMLSDGIPIGGTSFPLSEEALYGVHYSIDGQTFEELHDIDYPTWHKAWIEKYSHDNSVIVDEPVDIETELLSKTETIFDHLEAADWLKLADHVHPTEGLFFSFYADAGSPYSNEVHFTIDELRHLEGTETFIWGQDMGDYTFEFSVNDYVEKILLGGSQQRNGQKTWEINYDVITFNDSEVDSGGIINTIPDYFPEAKYVEYYSPRPSEELWYQWQALRFIYEEHEGEWYLIGIARDVHSP
ncbi:MAG: hypothetical protein ACK4M9_02825 [Anaerobacillus sp.]|uniref:hypothetical protein n=1 Tax=Anaerobacillus sp. TaxID=1872506 RepID=UPI0039187D6A